MKYKIAGLLAVLLCSSSMASAQSNSSNLPKVTVLDANNSEFVEEGKAGLRLNFVLTDVEDFEDLNIYSVDICTRPKFCERLLKESLSFSQYTDGTVNFANVLTTPGIKGTFLRINTREGSKTRNSAKGPKLASRVVKLEEPLILTTDVRYDLFLKLDKNKNANRSKGRVIYKPSYGGGALISPSDSVISLVQSGSSAVLEEPENGFSLIIDGDSVISNSVVGIEGTRENFNTGNFFISPDLKIESPITLEVVFDRPDLQPGTVGANMDIQYNNLPVDLQFSRLNSDGREVYEISIAEPGFLEINAPDPFENVPMNLPSPLKEGVPLDVNQRAAAVTPLNSFANPCAARISTVTANGYYDYVDSVSGSVTFNTCYNLDPELEILIHSNTRSGRSVDYQISPQFSPTFPFPPYNLRTISQHNSDNGSFAAVNAFFWQGDQGTGPGFATALNNFQFINGRSVGSSTQANVVSIGFEDTIFRTNPAKFFDLPQFSTLQNTSFNDQLISSTSSVIKNGVCTTDTSNNLWSAMGLFDDGAGRQYVVVLSTRTGQKTTPAQLCEVFKAFNIRNAIRLDGGPSASFSVNGVHKNPLGYPERFKYGRARYLGSAFTFK